MCWYVKQYLSPESHVAALGVEITFDINVNSKVLNDTNVCICVEI